LFETKKSPPGPATVMTAAVAEKGSATAARKKIDPSFIGEFYRHGFRRQEKRIPKSRGAIKLERGWIHGRRSSKGLNDVFFGNDFAYQSLILTTLPVGFSLA
jgi:hypothetical protein